MSTRWDKYLQGKNKKVMLFFYLAKLVGKKTWKAEKMFGNEGRAVCQISAIIGNIFLLTGGPELANLHLHICQKTKTAGLVRNLTQKETPQHCVRFFLYGLSKLLQIFPEVSPGYYHFCARQSMYFFHLNRKRKQRSQNEAKKYWKHMNCCTVYRNSKIWD